MTRTLAPQPGVGEQDSSILWDPAAELGEGTSAVKANQVPYMGDGAASQVVTDPDAPAGLEPIFVVIWDISFPGNDGGVFFNTFTSGDAISAGNIVFHGVLGTGTVDVGTSGLNANFNGASYRAILVYGARAA